MIPQDLPVTSKPLHTVVEKVERRGEKIIAPAEDSISLTRDMLKNIVVNALEEQKKQADANSKEVIKSA